MIKESKTRVMISIPKALDNDIQVLSDQMGMTKSAFISMCVGEKIMGYKKAFEIASDTLKVYSDSINKPLDGGL